VYSDLLYPGNGKRYNTTVEILQTGHLQRNSMEKYGIRIGLKIKKKSHFGAIVRIGSVLPFSSRKTAMFKYVCKIQVDFFNNKILLIQKCLPQYIFEIEAPSRLRMKIEKNIKKKKKMIEI